MSGPKRKIIGLGHYSRTGKDTIANLLIDKLSVHALHLDLKVRKMPFAWKLKQICYQLYGWAGLREPEYYETPEGEADRDVVIPAIGKTPVQIWVAMGTPAVRDNVYDRTWIDYVLYTYPDDDVLIIPDVRFPNEVAAIRAEGGIVIKVLRRGRQPRDTVADQALVDFNDWDDIYGPTFKSHHSQVELLFEWIRFGGQYKPQSKTLQQGIRNYVATGEICTK